MLGISSDSETIAMPRALCKCDTLSQCSDGNSCECASYCPLYAGIYLVMKQELSKLCFLTFSPKPPTQSGSEFTKGLVNERADFKKFIDRFIDTKNIKNYIAVTELTLKGQIHYHILLTFRSKVTFIKQVIQPLYYLGNVLPIYNTGPQKGMHYLFKSQKLMTEYHGKTTIYSSSGTPI